MHVYKDKQRETGHKPHKMRSSGQKAHISKLSVEADASVKSRKTKQLTSENKKFLKSVGLILKKY